MRTFLTLGPAPADEACAQVGTPDYRKRAMHECRRFIDLVRRVFGPEPDGALLQSKAFDHDFGVYYEVVCWFDTDMPASVAYAYRCENETPATWEG
jgi:hypothetical protein